MIFFKLTDPVLFLTLNDLCVFLDLIYLSKVCLYVVFDNFSEYNLYFYYIYEQYKNKSYIIFYNLPITVRKYELM